MTATLKFLSNLHYSNIQFRWWQAGDPLAPAFGLDDVYIGQSCPGHCSGHGVCRNGDCECDSGYHGRYRCSLIYRDFSDYFR